MNRAQETRHGALATAALALALVAAGLPAAAGAIEPAADEMALVTVYANGVDFRPEVAYRQAELRVAGPGAGFSRTLGFGEPISIGMFDPAGNLLADGRYTWRLELVPTQRDAARLRAAAKRARREGRPAPRGWQALTGAFTIAGGALADPALAEAGTVRSNAGGAPAPLPTAVGPRQPVADDDDSVSFRGAVEAEVEAAARRAPAALAGAAGDDTDAVATALGRSAEHPAATSIDPRSQGFAPTPRSDGSNGRPRS